MKIVHYYSQLLRHQSGVTMSMACWARAQQAHGHDVVLLSAAAGPERGEDLDDLTVRVVPHRGRARASYLPIRFQQAVRGADLLVLHEGWVFSNAAAARGAVRAGVPYVVVPHGVYEPGVMAGLKSRKPIRERVERAILEAAIGVHVFFPTEAELVHRIAPRADCFAVATGVTSGSLGGWRGGGGYLAWMGRYAPEHKGLTRLIDVLATFDPEVRPVLRMHGSDFLGGLARVREQVARLRLDEHVHIDGPVYGEDKESFLRHADAYVLPSVWESQGLALVEALQRGVPAIVSDSIHIAPLLRKADAAVVCPTTADAFGAALRRVRTDRAGLSERAVDFVQSTLDWDSAIKEWDDAVHQRLRPAGR